MRALLAELHVGMSLAEIERCMHEWRTLAIDEEPWPSIPGILPPDSSRMASPVRAVGHCESAAAPCTVAYPRSKALKRSGTGASKSSGVYASPIRFSQAAAEALRELRRTEGMSILRRKEYLWAISAFQEWLEDDPFADDITSAIAGRYKVDLTFYPSSASKRPQYRSLSFKDRVRAARAIGETRLLKLTSINSNYLLPLRRIF